MMAVRRGNVDSHAGGSILAARGVGMRYRWQRVAFVLGVVGLFSAEVAHGRYYYPRGYGRWGWGGWGVGADYGAYARGLGWLAAGQGVYNLDTAAARSINVNTAIRLNEYMYESILNHDRQLWKRKAKELKDYKDAYSALQNRLRNNPTPRDIDSGDALNIALDELGDPRYAYAVQQEANIKIDGSLIRNIPFRNAVEAVTLSLNELTDGDQPEIFLGPEFANDVTAYRAITDELNNEVETSGTVKPQTVGKMRDVLNRVKEKLKSIPDLDPTKRFDAERHLRALMGLSYMLDGPSLEIFLADVENRDDVTLAKLLGFMQSFNLRFGIAQTPSQKEAYRTLYPMLVRVRDQLFGEGTGTLPSNAASLSDRSIRPGEFFAGMHPDELDPKANLAKGPPQSP